MLLCAYDIWTVPWDIIFILTFVLFSGARAKKAQDSRGSDKLLKPLCLPPPRAKNLP